VSGGGVSAATERRIFCPAVVHPVHTDRHDIVGRVLYQSELGPGTCVARRDHRADDDDHCQVVVAGLRRFVLGGARRLVRHVHGLRVRRAARVRSRQCGRSPREKGGGKPGTGID